MSYDKGPLEALPPPSFEGTGSSPQPSEQNESSSQANGRLYVVVHSESGLISTTTDKSLKSSLNEIHEFVNQHFEILDSDQLKHLEATIQDRISSLNGRAEKLVEDSRVLSKMPKFLQNIAKKFAELAFRGIDLAGNEGNQKVGAETLRMLEQQLPFRETTERNISTFAKQIRTKSENKLPQELTEALARLQMQQIPASEKQAAITTIESALKQSVEEMKNGNPEGAEKATALLRQTFLLLKNNELGGKINQSFLEAAEKGFDSAQPDQVDTLAKQLRTVVNPFKDKNDALSKSPLGRQLENVITEKTWNRFNDLKPAIVNQTDNIEFGETDSTVPEMRSVDFNNYGLRPDPDSVKYKEDTKFVASFSFNGENYDLTGSDQKVIFDEKQGMLFNKGMGGAQLNYDQVNVKELESGAVLMTLCDGCGQSGGALRAAKEVLRLSEGNEEDFDGLPDSHAVASKQLDRLQSAQEQLLANREEIEGDTTFVQAYIQAGVLCGVAVGDAKLFVMSKDQEGNWTCKDLTKDASALRDATDSGGRFCGQTRGAPELDTVKSISHRLEKGDIVLISSDGVADCFDPHILDNESKDIETNMASLLKDCETSADMQERIQDHLQKVTFEEKIIFLTSNKAKPPHQKGWGKMDNANMGFFTYQ